MIGMGSRASLSLPGSLAEMERVMKELEGLGNPNAVLGMTRFGIQTDRAFGVSLPKLRILGRRIGTNHELAQQLWKSRFHEARLLAGMIDDPAKVTEDQMEERSEERRV